MRNVPIRATGEAVSDHHTSCGVSPSTLPKVYALSVSGDCMLPGIADGELVEVHRDEMPEAGDLCAIYFRKHVTLANNWGALLKKMVFGPPSGTTFPFEKHPQSTVSPLLIVESLNPPKQHVFYCEDILAIHKVVGTIDRSRTHRAAACRPEKAPSRKAKRAVEVVS